MHEETAVLFLIGNKCLLRKVHRSGWSEGLEVEERTEHWGLGNVIGSHPRSPVHGATTVDEYIEHPEEYPRFAGRCCCRLG